MAKKYQRNCAIGQLSLISNFKDAWTKLFELSKNTLSEILESELGKLFNSFIN